MGSNRLFNGLPQSQLTPEQRAIREALFEEWLNIHAALAARMRAARLSYSAAVPSWTDDYYGEPLEATFGGVTDSLTAHLLALVPQIVVMSYRTESAAILERAAGELRLADTLSGTGNVLLAVETHAGPGQGVSYADTPQKRSRRHVLNDLAAVSRRAYRYSAYAGWCIHDWSGWSKLPH